MKNLIIATVALISSGLSAQEFDYLPTSTTDQIIKHSYYTLSYSEKNKLAEWVAYRLTSEMINGNTEPAFDYRADPLLPSGSADYDDYKHSGYVKAHLVPLEDMKFNEKAMSECFYMSNISPQSSSFNSGIWKELEDRVRDWALENGELYVVTGGILNNTRGHFGTGKVSVPGEYYKVVLDTDPDYKIIGFLMRNEKGFDQLKSYAVTVDYIETRTGIDFFPFLPDHIEDEIESTIDREYWNLDKNSSLGESAEAVQCKGIGRTTGVRCKNKTTNPNGYCKLHQDQASDSSALEDK